MKSCKVEFKELKKIIENLEIDNHEFEWVDVILSRKGDRFSGNTDLLSIGFAVNKENILKTVGYSVEAVFPREDTGK